MACLISQILETAEPESEVVVGQTEMLLQFRHAFFKPQQRDPETRLIACFSTS
jgi:hypothetical protein